MGLRCAFSGGSKCRLRYYSNEEVASDFGRVAMSSPRAKAWAKNCDVVEYGEDSRTAVVPKVWVLNSGWHSLCSIGFGESLAIIEHLLKKYVNFAFERNKQKVQWMLFSLISGYYILYLVFGGHFLLSWQNCCHRLKFFLNVATLNYLRFLSHNLILLQICQFLMRSSNKTSSIIFIDAVVKLIYQEIFTKIYNLSVVTYQKV